MLVTVGYDLPPMVAAEFTRFTSVWAYLDQFDPEQGDIQLFDFAPALLHLFSEMAAKSGEPAQERLANMWAHWAANTADATEARTLHNLLIAAAKGIDEGLSEQWQADQEDPRRQN